MSELLTSQSKPPQVHDPDDSVLNGRGLAEQLIAASHDLIGPRPVGAQPTPLGTHTSNPVRIGRISNDQVQVFIRPMLDNDELLAVVERLERLLDAGYDSIDVVFEAEVHQTALLTRLPAPPATRSELNQRRAVI
ncbi:MAG: hypothetical protein WBA45_01565 [Microthrixaceae bacterium]